jgi:GAF domain-containing protein
MLAVERYRLPEAPADGAFDRVTAIAARVFSVPVALVTIVDHDRIWFTSHHGLEIDHIDRHPGLCASAILDDVPWVVEDARFDPRTLANPLVAEDFGLQFYAGVPLRTRDGHNLGTLCVLDFEPRLATEQELASLGDLAAIVMSEMELRLESRRSVAALESAIPTPL